MKLLIKSLEWVKDGDCHKASRPSGISYTITRNIDTPYQYKLETIGSTNRFDGLYVALSAAKFGAEVHGRTLNE